MNSRTELTVKCQAWNLLNIKPLTTILITPTRITANLLSKFVIIAFLTLPGVSLAQERPNIFFREDFKEIPAEVPISQAHIVNSNLLISLYGTAANQIKKSHHDTPEDDPYYVWSGLCEGSWAVTLTHQSKYVDLTQYAKIRWRSKQSGLRQLHIIVKLVDDTWLISDQSDSYSADWRVKEFNIQDISWRSLDIESMTEKNFVEHPDLSMVKEIGWTDLMKGGGSEACSRIDWMEVAGFPVLK